MSTRLVLCACVCAHKYINIYKQEEVEKEEEDRRRRKMVERARLCRQEWEREREGRPELKAFVCSFQTDLAGTPALRRLGRGCGRVSRGKVGLVRPQKRTFGSARRRGFAHWVESPSTEQKLAQRIYETRSIGFTLPCRRELHTPVPRCAVGTSRLSWNGANSFPWKPTSYNSVHFGL